MLEHLFDEYSASVIENADVGVLDVMKARVKKEGNWALHIGYGKWSGVVDKLLDAKHTGAKTVAKWLLSEFAEEAISYDDTQGIEVVKKAGITPKEMGITSDEAVMDKVESIVDDLLEQIEEIDNGYYDDDDDDDKPNVPEGLPASVLWLLDDGHGKLDDAKMKVMLGKLPEWADNNGYEFDPLLDRIVALGAKWKKPVAAAKKKIADGP